MPPDWTDQAACIDAPPPGLTDENEHLGAGLADKQLLWKLHYCAVCPVWEPCVQFGFDTARRFSKVPRQFHHLEIYAGVHGDELRTVPRSQDAVERAKEEIGMLRGLKRFIDGAN